MARSHCVNSDQCLFLAPEDNVLRHSYQPWRPPENSWALFNAFDYLRGLVVSNRNVCKVIYPHVLQIYLFVNIIRSRFLFLGSRIFPLKCLYLIENKMHKTGKYYSVNLRNNHVSCKVFFSENNLVLFKNHVIFLMARHFKLHLIFSN